MSGTLVVLVPVGLMKRTVRVLPPYLTVSDTLVVPETRSGAAWTAELPMAKRTAAAKNRTRCVTWNTKISPVDVEKIYWWTLKWRSQAAKCPVKADQRQMTRA